MEENNDERMLNALIGSFYDHKQKADHYKKEAEAENLEIKDTMNTMNIKEFNGDFLTAKINIQKRESFNDAKLLNLLDSYKDKIPGLIVMKPVVDMDKLEDAIYNGLLDATLLTPAKEVKEVVTLKVTKRKE